MNLFGWKSRPPRTTARDYLDFYRPIVEGEIEAWCKNNDLAQAIGRLQLTPFGELVATVEWTDGSRLREISTDVPLTWGGYLNRQELGRYLSYWVKRSEGN